MFGLDRRAILIILAVLIIFTVVENLSNPASLLDLVLSVPGVLIAITFHEFAHGYAAYKLGDNTAKDEGRLSLNPMDHIDPIGILMLLTVKFGWGKPVHVNPTNYTRKISMEKGEAIVSAAGPLTNIVLAFIFTLIYVALYKFAGAFIGTSTVGSMIMQVVSATITINIGLGVFNLIPLPPLDGSKIIKPILPTKIKYWFESNEQIFYIIFIIIFITGIASRMITPLVIDLTTLFLKIGAMIFGINII